MLSYTYLAKFGFTLGPSTYSLPRVANVTYEIHLGAQNLAKMSGDARTATKKFCDVRHDFKTSSGKFFVVDALALENKAFGEGPINAFE